MRLLAQLRVPVSWSRADGPRHPVVRVLSPARDTPLWQALMGLALATLGFVQAAVLDVHDGAYGKLIMNGALSFVALTWMGRRVKGAQDLKRPEDPR